MGGAGPIATKNGKKAVDAAINLVPFIDLLSCCISFLLITAVWTQLGKIEAAPSQASGVNETELDPSPSLTVYVDGGGHTIVRSTGQKETIGRRGGELDYAGLATVLTRLRGEMPERTDVVVKCSDGIEYGDLIRTMDAALAAKFSALRVDGEAG